MISSSVSKAGPYAGDGSTKLFGFGFYTLAAADIKVISTASVSGSSVDTTLVSGADYSVSINADQSATPGGNITLAAAPAAGVSISILRNMSMTQSASLPNQGGFYPKVIEFALDRLVMIVQQMAEEVSRSLKVSPADSNASVAAILAQIAAAGQAAASASSSNAVAAAASAAAAAGYASAANASANATSSTTLLLGNGSRSLTLAQTGKAFVVGQIVAITDTASPSSKWMLGQITAFDTNTGAMTVSVTDSVGIGSGSSWTVSVSSPFNLNAFAQTMAALSYMNQ